MSRHHTIISGTGRSGTTFLVELLTGLGLDTGFDPTTVKRHKYTHANAGLEHRLFDATAPYVVKDPHMNRYLAEVLATGEVCIDFALIPMRNLEAAAESRRAVDRRAYAHLSLYQQLRHRLRRSLVFNGGSVRHSDGTPGSQEFVLMEQVYTLLTELARHHVPVIFLHFPTLIYQPHYTYGKLLPLLSACTYSEFRKVFDDVVEPGAVHHFSGDS